MKNSTPHKPELLYFRDTPQNWLEHPPLASSLQNLETSFLLVAMTRYASALVSCASAVEGAIKAAFPKNHRLQFESLLEKANSAFPPNCAFPKSDLDEFRRKRNEIIHFGFTSLDEEIAAVLLLKTGYRLVEQCYETFFGYRLKRDGEQYGLWPNLDRHLEIAQSVYQKVNGTAELALTYCFIPLGHDIRWHIQGSMMSAWQKQVLQEEEEQFERPWALQSSHKNQLLRETFNNAWEFDCSVCGYTEALLCELDDEALDHNDIRLKRAVCVQCGLIIPRGCPFLADELCADQLGEARARIFKEFGLG